MNKIDIQELFTKYLINDARKPNGEQLDERVAKEYLAAFDVERTKGKQFADIIRRDFDPTFTSIYKYNNGTDIETLVEIAALESVVDFDKSSYSRRFSAVMNYYKKFIMYEFDLHVEQKCPILQEPQSINGIDSLVNLFENDNKLIIHLIENTFFIDPNSVAEQASKVTDDIDNNLPIPVRFSTKDKEYYVNNQTRRSYPSFDNKSKAVAYTNNLENFLYSTLNGIRISIDRDGNYASKNAIKSCTNHRVSWGKISTITNFTIAHIWGKTNNPLYFSLMWNYCLVPNYLSQITDKDPATCEITRKVLEVLKAVSIVIYNPNKLMGRQVLLDDDMPSDNAIKTANQLLAGGKIKYLKKI